MLLGSNLNPTLWKVITTLNTTAIHLIGVIIEKSMPTDMRPIPSAPNTDADRKPTNQNGNNARFSFNKVSAAK